MFTQKQGQFGLGLEAQRASVTTYAQAHALELIASFIEMETGICKKHRPELEAALAFARRV